MDGAKKPTATSSIADELFGRKVDAGRSSQSGLFGSIFPAPSSGAGRDALQPDLFGSAPSRKHGSTTDHNAGQSWSAHSHSTITPSGFYGNSHGSPSKSQSMPHKDSSYSGEALNTCNLSSSLYYGGQDICSNTSSTHGYGSQYTKKSGDDDQDNSNMASRGNWWQGSLYY